MLSERQGARDHGDTDSLHKCLQELVQLNSGPPWETGTKLLTSLPASSQGSHQGQGGIARGAWIQTRDPDMAPQELYNMPTLCVKM